MRWWPAVSIGSEGRWRSYGYEELFQRDKVSLDIFWLKDDSLDDIDSLPPPDIIAAEIVENLQAAFTSAMRAELARGGEPDPDDPNRTPGRWVRSRS